MIVSKFLVDVSALPRASYTILHCTGLLSVFRNLIATVGLTDSFPLIDFSGLYVHVYTISENINDDSYLKELVSRTFDVQCETMEVASPEEFSLIKIGQFCVDVVNFDNDSNAIWSFVGECAMIIDKNPSDQVSPTVCVRGITEVLPESRFKAVLDRNLERLALKQFYLRVRLLQALIRLNVDILNDLNQCMEMRMADEISRRQDRGDNFDMEKLCWKARNDVLLNKLQGIFGEECNVIIRQIFQDTVLANDGSAEELAREFERNLFKFQVLVDRVEREREQIIHLYGRIVGMFHRSGVPEEEKPKGASHLQLDQETVHQILSVKGVISCGFQFSVLHVYLDPGMSNEEKKRAEILLQDMMRWNNIDHSVFSSGSVVNFSRFEEQIIQETMRFVVGPYFTRTRSVEGVFPR